MQLCFVWIWEQTAIISLHSINWLVFITEIVFTTRYGLNLCLLYIIPSKSSGHCMYRQFNIQQFYVLPTQCIYEFCVHLRTEIISLYSINWPVFITETENVYCAVRPGSMCFVWIWEQTAIISVYNINWLVFITETHNVYCAVRPGSMCIIDITTSKPCGHYMYHQV